MISTVPLQTTEQSAPVSAGCFHCGEPVPAAAPWGATVLGCWRPMCCPGCQAVSEAIVAGGLESFYTQRDVLSRPVVPAALTTTPAVAHALDDPDWQLGRVVNRGAESEAVLAIESMECPACAWLIEQQLQQLDGVRRVAVSYATQRLTVRWSEPQTRLSAIIGAIAALGYRAAPFNDATAHDQRRRQGRAAMWRLFVAGLSMMQVMMLALPLYVAAPGDMSEQNRQLLRWAEFALTVPVVLWSAAPFFIAAARDLRLWRLGMDVPVALGIATAFASSCAALLLGGEVYFDSITMFIFFLLTSRYLEMRARERAARWIDRLASGLPELADRLIDHPHSMAVESVAIERLVVGNRVQVARGATVPADGRLLSERAELDESLVTGESRPVWHQRDALLIGGAVNRGEPLVLELTQSAASGTRADLAALVERALSERQWPQRLADRYASAFTLVVLLAAAVTLAFWWSAGIAQAMAAATAVLVVTCPCALALATPLALLAATARMATEGVLATSAGALERLARVTRVAFDKTGTLTDARLELIKVHPLAGTTRAQALALAAALEAGATHPVARALRAAALSDQAQVSRVTAQQGDTRIEWPIESSSENQSGNGLERAMQSPVEGRVGNRIESSHGVSGIIDDRHLRLGNLALCGEPAGAIESAVFALASERPEHLLAILADATGWLAVFVLRDHVRDEAPGALERLRGLGVRLHLLSGDRRVTTQAMADTLGIETWEAPLDPAGKCAALHTLQGQGEVVAMVGDGFNDAPVLASADCAISLAGATSLARISADLILLRDDLRGVPAALAIARRTRSIVRQNLLWALLYNLAGIPLAAAGWVAPWLAGLGMALSSLVVVINSLRLLPRGH